MGKIKKFIDFEIVTLLTIIILISPFYLLTVYTTTTEDIVAQENFEVSDYQISLEFNKMSGNRTYENPEIFKLQISDFENNLLYISNSDFDVLGIFVGIVLLVVNIIAMIIYLIKYMIKIMIISRNRKILADENGLENIDLPTYNIAIANTLYTGKINFYKIYNIFKKYFKDKGMIDDKGNILENVDIKALNELEQFFIPLYKSEITDEIRKQFKNKLVQELEKRRFLDNNNNIRKTLDKIAQKIEKTIKWLFSKERDESIRIIIETTIPFVILLLIAALKYFSIILIIAIIYIQSKYYNIFLTKEGKKERAKIILLLDNLKKKEERAEKEKFFYDALKYTNL